MKLDDFDQQKHVIGCDTSKAQSIEIPSFVRSMYQHLVLCFEDVGTLL